MTGSENKTQSASTSSTSDMITEMLETSDKGFTESEINTLEALFLQSTYSILDDELVNEIYNRRM